jgi:flagellar biosynthesis protein FlhB
MPSPSDRTEKPTPRKLIKARREGQFAASKDFVSGLQFTVFVLLLAAWGPKVFTGFKDAAGAVLRQAFRSDLGQATLLEIVRQSFTQSMVPLAAGSALLVATGVVFQLASTRFSFSLHRLVPKPANFSPIAKLKSIPQKGFGSAVQAVALVLVFGVLIYWIVVKNASLLLVLPLASLQVGLETMRSLCLSLLWKAVAFFLLFGMIDLFRQHRRFNQQMRMTKQEVRDEMKETEGNPQIKMRIRRLQRDARRRRMMDEVKTATAVVVNPTHYAVAIRYQHDLMSAPVVVAKGKNYLALRIRARAVEHQVPLIENPPLAQALYKSVDVGQQIPPHLYRAVAEILAYIYRLMGAKAVS